MSEKICPNCGRRYKGLAMYCTKCGIELKKDKNLCSEMRTQLCRDKVFEDDDIFCCYCGSLTTFAAEKIEKEKFVPERAVEK